VVLPGGEPWVAGKSTNYQLLSDAAVLRGGIQGWMPPVRSPVAARLPWTRAFGTWPIDPRLAGRRRHCPPATPAEGFRAPPDAGNGRL